jgi:hypothetical protein
MIAGINTNYVDGKKLKVDSTTKRNIKQIKFNALQKTAYLPRIAYMHWSEVEQASNGNRYLGGNSDAHMIRALALLGKIVVNDAKAQRQPIVAHFTGNYLHFKLSMVLVSKGLNLSIRPRDTQTMPLYYTLMLLSEIDPGNCFLWNFSETVVANDQLSKEFTAALKLKKDSYQLLLKTGFNPSIGNHYNSALRLVKLGMDLRNAQFNDINDEGNKLKGKTTVEIQDSCSTLSKKLTDECHELYAMSPPKDYKPTEALYTIGILIDCAFVYDPSWPYNTANRYNDNNFSATILCQEQMHALLNALNAKIAISDLDMKVKFPTPKTTHLYAQKNGTPKPKVRYNEHFTRPAQSESSIVEGVSISCKSNMSLVKKLGSLTITPESRAASMVNNKRLKNNLVKLHKTETSSKLNPGDDQKDATDPNEAIIEENAG